MQRKCNCIQKVQCPMNGECLLPNVVYEGEVTNITDDITRLYVSVTQRPWKDRRAVHNSGINHREYSIKSELTKYIWSLKDAGKQYKLTWRILEKVKGKLIGGECKLCVAEKLHIITHPKRDLLINSKTAIMCKHKSKWMLASLDEDKPKRGRPKGSKNKNRETGIT